MQYDEHPQNFCRSKADPLHFADLSRDVRLGKRVDDGVLAGTAAERTSEAICLKVQESPSETPQKFLGSLIRRIPKGIAMKHCLFTSISA